MSLILLPVEIITRALQCLEPGDLNSTQRVCRYLRKIIAGDLYLQYVLELEKSGYTFPRFIRQDIGYSEMIEVIRSHRERWQRVELDEPKPILVPNTPSAILHSNCLSDDIYAFCFETFSGNEGISSSVRLYELSSINKGTEYKHWVHDNLGFHVSALAIQPELDLMALLELYPLEEPNPEQHQRYRVHFRTMITNEPHPLAASSPLALNVGGLPDFSLDNPSSLGLCGRILILRLRPSSIFSGSRLLIVIFNWVAGVEVGRITLESRAGYSIAFLSEEYFIIPQGYDEFGTAPNKPTGALLVFYLPPHVEGSEDQQARLVATLAFPRISEYENELALHLCGGNPPIPDTAFWSTRAKPVPKIYELKRWDHICLHYEVFNNGTAPRASGHPPWCFEKELGATGLLHVSSQAILALLNQHLDVAQRDEPVLMPWETWGEYAASLPVMDVPNARMWGRQLIEEKQKQVERDGPSTPAGRSHASARERAIPVEQAVSQFREDKPAIVDMRFRKTIINLKSEKQQSLCARGLQIGDEHLVTGIVTPRSPVGENFYYVYTV